MTKVSIKRKREKHFTGSIVLEQNYGIGSFPYFNIKWKVCVIFRQVHFKLFHEAFSLVASTQKRVFSICFSLDTFP